jgi:formylmethanofuran dehydrogenase subunit B
MHAPRVVSDVACTICGCVCDDLRMTIDGGRITKAEGACHLAEPWFLAQETQEPPAAQIESQPAPIDEAIARSADILRAAKWPLVFGLSRSSTEGQRAAVRLADLIGSNIDTTASTCHAPSILAIQDVGESTCSLGEIRNRADLVVFWGVDPVVTHPRHGERYSMDATGMFVPRGRSDRTVILVDEKENSTRALADHFVRIEPDRHFEAIWTLRCLLRGIEPEPNTELGADIEALRDLCERAKSCRCGVFFFGLELAQSRLGHLSVDGLLRLVAELNAHTRFHARRMRMQGDVTGADTVLCWQTGFPFAVNLSRGYPRYGPDEFSAQQMLERGEVDACLFVGTEGVVQISSKARAHLARIPTIALDYPTIKSSIEPTIRFTTSVYGIHRAGTVYRMDEVPIPLRALLPPKYASDAEILDRIADRLRAD